MQQFESVGPIPKLEDIASRLIGPIIDGPPDLIDGLLPQQGQLVVAGQTNVGKSLIAIEICSALTSDRPLWGEIYPAFKAKKILYILGEHYSEVIMRLWRHTGLPMSENVWLLGPEQLSYDKWLVTSGKPNIQAISKMKKWAEGSDLIVFDPFSAFVTGVDVENDNIQMRLVLDTMSLIAQTAGASCIVLAHQGKPMMDRFGQEHSRKSYAIRGASAIEDAATNIFYLDKATGESEAAQKASGGQIFEVVKRKYKGPAPDKYRLLRDTGTLTHALLGNRPFAEVISIDRQAKVAKLQGAFPDMPFKDVIRAVAAIQGCSEITIKRDLGVA